VVEEDQSIVVDRVHARHRIVLPGEARLLDGQPVLICWL
jgi:hypothetical protein